MSKVNLNIPEVEIREIRLGSITGFQGTAKELVTACSGCAKLKDKNRSFSQCLGCGTSNAACTLTLIQDAAIISHGPVGCSTCLHEFAFTYRVNAYLRQLDHPTQRKIFSTNLEEKDTIAVFCEGFRSKMWTSGFDAGYHGIARKIIKPARQKRNIINVINFWGSDIFREWFAELGYEPNYITPFSTVDSLSYSSEAALTVQACSTLGSYLGAALEQSFGVPEIRNSPPYGIAQTDRWFRELGQILGKEKEVEELLARKKKEYLPKIEALREKLKGRTAYVTAGASHGHSLLALLKELGMEPQGAAIFHHDPQYDNEDERADTLRHTVEDYGDVPNYNVCNKQEFELVNVLNRIKPDILLARHGGMTLWGAKLGIPSLLVGDEHFGMGYEGLVNYGERILETIENVEFVKNLAKHSSNPYTKWWLEQEPYTFLGK